MTISDGNTVAFLGGGGGMGKMIRSRDWSVTALGAPEAWPQSLQISISILLNSQFPMFVWWGEEYLTFYNDAYRVILGDKHPYALGASGPVVWSEIWDVVGPMARRVKENGQSNWAEDQVLYINRRGYVEETYFTFSYSPVLDVDGKIAGVFCACTETTEKVFANRQLKESESRFRTLADESPMFVFIIDADPLAHVSYWNQTWLQYTGRTEALALGRAWDGILHPDDVPVVMQYYSPAFEKREQYFIPAVRVKRHDGEYRWHTFKGNPRYLSSGVFDGYIGVGFDIHEQKLAEEALRRSEARTRLAVETAQLGTFEIDVAAQAMIYSARTAEMFGLDPTKQWPYTAFTDQVHPDDAPIRKKAHEVALHSGDLLYESRIVNPDNSIRWIRLNGRYSEIGSSANTLIGTVMDITQEKRAAEMLEQKIEERTRELKQINDQLKQFAYSASHDLQEPLRKISYFLDRLLINLSSSLDDENKKIAERIQHTTGKMRVLIDDLLSYSNTTLGITITEEVALTSVIKDVLDDMEATLIEQDAKIDLYNLPTVKGDHRQLRQLMQNLISNAVKYRNKDKKPQVEISAQTIRGIDVKADIPPDIRKKSLYLITIKDNGIGFDSSQAESIFTLFRRLHGKSEYEGTGVGLAIAQKVVENHRGYIWAEGSPGEGAKFNVLLPAE